MFHLWYDMSRFAECVHPFFSLRFQSSHLCHTDILNTNSAQTLFCKVQSSQFFFCDGLKSCHNAFFHSVKDCIKISVRLGVVFKVWTSSVPRYLLKSICILHQFIPQSIGVRDKYATLVRHELCSISNLRFPLIQGCLLYTSPSPRD